MVESPFGRFAIFVGHVENGDPYPFEVWVNGNEQPRGLGAVAKTLSMDMRAQDAKWLRMKLDMLARAGRRRLRLPDAARWQDRCACRAWSRRSRASCASASISSAR